MSLNHIKHAHIYKPDRSVIESNRTREEEDLTVDVFSFLRTVLVCCCLARLSCWGFALSLLQSRSDVHTLHHTYLSTVFQIKTTKQIKHHTVSFSVLLFFFKLRILYDWGDIILQMLNTAVSLFIFRTLRLLSPYYPLEFCTSLSSMEKLGKLSESNP